MQGVFLCRKKTGAEGELCMNCTNETLQSLSIKAGLAPSTLKNALRMSYPKGERIIAEAIGVPPQVIWAKRYAERENRLCGSN